VVINAWEQLGKEYLGCEQSTEARGSKNEINKDGLVIRSLSLCARRLSFMCSFNHNAIIARFSLRRVNEIVFHETGSAPFTVNMIHILNMFIIVDFVVARLSYATCVCVDDVT